MFLTFNVMVDRQIYFFISSKKESTIYQSINIHVTIYTRDKHSIYIMLLNSESKLMFTRFVLIFYYEWLCWASVQADPLPKRITRHL